MKHAFLLAATLLCTPALAGPYYFDSYLPFANRWSYHIPPGGTSAAGQWATWSNNATDMTIYWTSDNSTTSFNWNALASVELFSVRQNCSNGGAWVFLNGYRHNSIPSITFWLVADKVLVKVAGGTTYDVTHVARGPGGCSTYNSALGGTGAYVGIPYAPYLLWDQSYEFEVWGKIANAQGNFTQRFYWKAFYQPGSIVTNPCWSGNNPSRLAILQKEAYWSSSAGWGTGSGSVDMTNLTATNIKYGRYHYYGKDAGPGWTAGTISANGVMSPTHTCLPNVWPY